jgi:adenine-specific DNA-methyltransferase
VIDKQEAAADFDDSLSVESHQYLKGRPKSERSAIGQFLTPKTLRDELIRNVPLGPRMRVLDPGVGTGEFLKSVLEREPSIDAYGWDIDKPALEVAMRLVPNASFEQRSALDDWSGNQFDVVIGNPPYFEMRNLEKSMRIRYERVISGRPNIFALFFFAGWNVLKDGGYLAYVVPPSMNNGAYFDRLRNFILDNFSIEFFKVFDNPHLFKDAQTAVQLIVLKKGNSTRRHWVDLGELSNSEYSRRVFVQDPTQLEAAFDGRATLHSLGYRAITGGVVWNNRKEDLSRDLRPGMVPLIWAHNISEETHVILDESREKKPQYVRDEKPLTGPAIVVNRITGSVGSGSLRCSLIPDKMRFVGENHVNVVIPRTDADQEVGWDDLLRLMRAPGINERVRLLTGNTQISATELTYWLPLDHPAV